MFAIVDASINPKIPIPDIDRVFVENLRLGTPRNAPNVFEQVHALEALPGVELVTVVATNPGGAVYIDGHEIRAT